MNNIFSMLTYSDITNLWEHGQNETLNLEFKKEISSDSKEIAKDVSSFANAEGGVIIYGIEENKGKAIKSNGIKICQNSERIQQIISSSTSPSVPIDIMSISETKTSEMEFIIVKIPKSPFMIHQVTTTSKYYIRNNTITTAHIYQPFEMKENEIALRYENRFRAKQEQEDFLRKKEQKIVKELGWNAYILISVVPHIRIPNSIKITEESFRNLFVNSSSTVIYSDLSNAFSSIPNYDGRSSDPHTVKRDYFEINNDRSIHFCINLDNEFKINRYRIMWYSCPLLHLANRVLLDTHYYGGSTFRINVNGSIPEDIQHDGRMVSDFEIQHEIPYSPINVKNEFLKIFEKFFEALHVDNSLQLFKPTIQKSMNELDASDSRI
mgnify:CR=1 FL=1